MAIYIDPRDVPDLDNIPSNVFAYLIKKHKQKLGQMQKNNDYYLGKHDIMTQDAKEDEVKVFSNYAKYVVDIVQGYYLGEPIKYNGTEEKKGQALLNAGVQAVLKNGSVTRYDEKLSNKVDLAAIIDCYDNQTISEIDAKVGKNMGIAGECYELVYANEQAIPRSAFYDGRNVIMVRDTTVNHNKLFAIVYEEREDLNNNKFYHVTVYTDHNSKEYKSRDLENFEFNPIPDTEQEHYFGEVPVIEYQNNDERQGDFEQVIPLIDGLNELFSARITDKKKFVNSILAMFGVTISDDDMKIVRDERYLDGIPTDARIEYIQKVFDEGSMNVLCNDIIREIHKMTLTVDMTDSNFAGNSSGQALLLKLMTMNMLVKNKMRNMEKGLKKRFQMYNTFLFNAGKMPIIDRKDVEIIFTVSVPIDRQEVVTLVTSLQGIVDDKTLLSQLWFIKDPDEALERIKKQKQEAQQEYLDSFAKQRALETSFEAVEGYSRGENAKDEEEPEEGNKKPLKGKEKDEKQE